MERLTKWTKNGATFNLGNVQSLQEMNDKVIEQIQKACNRLAELEDKLESGELLELSTKPLTIEELKALPYGDWVWVVDLEDEGGSYWHKSASILFNPMNEDFKDFIAHGESYGTKWLAYKNKEQAEARLEELQGEL